jgi:hypothetical protein
MTSIDGLGPIVTAWIQQAKKSFDNENVSENVEVNRQISNLYHSE